ncbi:MAG TPA: peptidylprolyl isomerase [Gemmatimonadales bacterium]|nr:peptidylprolyl isomerase [Gemmatimonadales bacterium]
MRRLMLVAAVALLAGCNNFKDLFSAHADVAAEAGPAELSAERLSDIMAGAKGLRPTRDGAEFVSRLWVDYSLFAQAVARGDVLSDSATIAEAMWPEITNTRANHWHDSLVARRGTVGPEAADSIYRGNDVRVFQHILYRVNQTATPEERAAVEKEARQTLARINRGADFGALASKVSQDPGSAADSGYLPPAHKGDFVAAFDSAGWKLAPGQVSDLVTTQYGYHIIKRPVESAVRDRLLDWVQESAAEELDRAYLDSLSATHHVKVRGEAPALMKAAVADPAAQSKSKDKLVDFDGGALTVSDFLMWTRALPPQVVGQISQAQDSQLVQFATALTQNVLLVRQADSAKIGLTPEEWGGMQEMFRAQLDTLRQEMELGSDASDSTVAEAERLKVAQLKVKKYFDDLMSGKAHLRPLPSTLGYVLRERGHYEVHPAGIQRAVEMAAAKQAKADSASGKPGTPAVPGQMRPAPGPAPLPQSPAPSSGGQGVSQK